MTIKELVEKYWRDFEVIAFQAVKDKLSQEIILKEKLTQSQKDGGYDGEFVLLTQCEDIIKILFEAKLRSNMNADLSINDFAKALIIAIVRQADTIYIVTNLHFSDNTLSILNEFSEIVPLGIQLLNGFSVKKFIESHQNTLNDVNMELIEFLTMASNINNEQTLPLKTYTFKEHDKKNEMFLNSMNQKFNSNNKNLLVRGNIGSGKSFYIEKLCDKLQSENKTVYRIDLSKCLTYKELFLELLKKTVKLSHNLIDLLNDNEFEEAFAKIGLFDSTKDDIKMFRFIFSREKNMDYDYSVLFSLMVDAYERIYKAARIKKTIIIAFFNLVYAQKEVLQLLLHFIKNSKYFSSVLEIADNSFWTDDYNNWNAIKKNITRCSNMQPVMIKDWTISEAQNYLKQYLVNLSDDNLTSIIKKYGRTPAELSNLVELIGYSHIYQNVPKELIFGEIMNINAYINNDIHLKSLEYLYLTNSDILYFFAFIYLLSGKAELKMIASYLNDPKRFKVSMKLISQSHIFTVDCQEVAVKNSKIEDCFNTFCQKNLCFFLIENICDFVNKKMDTMHISLEKKMILECRINYFKEKSTYISSLLKLADRYLELNHLTLSEAKYRECIELMSQDLDLYVSSFNRIKIYVGLIESLIWNIGDRHNEIEPLFSLIEDLIQSLNSTSSSKILILRYYTLKYQFYHTLNDREKAFQASYDGIAQIDNDLYELDLELCGKMWRFYAISIKETTQDINKCLSVFDNAPEICHTSAKFLFGYIIHKNMNVKEADCKKVIQTKIKNYNVLYELEKNLSIDEYLHYKTNIAALHFLNKDYTTAWKEYEELLEKSDLFEINREKVRILNDMANICWINNDIKEAQKKYYMAKKLSMLCGVKHNYWPVLINLTSFEIFKKNYTTALAFSKALLPYIEQLCKDFTKVKVNSERKGYIDAALKIHLKNLHTLFNTSYDKVLISDMKKILVESQIYNVEDENDKTILEIIKNFDLKNTIYDHNGIFLLKD